MTDNRTQEDAIPEWDIVIANSVCSVLDWQYTQNGHAHHAPHTYRHTPEGGNACQDLGLVRTYDIFAANGSFFGILQIDTECPEMYSVIPEV